MSENLYPEFRKLTPRSIHTILISLFILSCFLFTSSNAWSAEGDISQVTLKVEGMSCPGCGAAIKSALKRIPGVVSADVSYKEKKATINYHEDKVTLEQIIKAIKDSGYRADLFSEKKR